MRPTHQTLLFRALILGINVAVVLAIAFLARWVSMLIVHLGIALAA